MATRGCRAGGADFRALEGGRAGCSRETSREPREHRPPPASTCLHLPIAPTGRARPGAERGSGRAGGKLAGCGRKPRRPGSSRGLPWTLEPRGRTTVPFYRWGSPRRRCDLLQVAERDPVSAFWWALKGRAHGTQSWGGRCLGRRGWGKQRLGLGFEGSVGVYHVALESRHCWERNEPSGGGVRWAWGRVR